MTKFETRSGTLYEIKNEQVIRNGNHLENALFVGTFPLENGKLRVPRLSFEGHLCDLVPDLVLGNNALFMNLAYKDQYWEKIGDRIKLLNLHDCPRDYLSNGLLGAYKVLTTPIVKIY